MKAQKRAVPARGMVNRIRIPDSMEGIRFEVARLMKYIVDARKDPLIITTAQKIAELSLRTARQAGRKLAKEPPDLIQLRGIHAWCRANFEHVSNPNGVEVIKTPARMLRELNIPEEITRALWEPIRDGFSHASGKDPKKFKLPVPKITGSSAVAVCLVLSLAGAIGLSPLRMRFGGDQDTLHHVWANIFAGGRFHDVDITLPEFGKCGTFETCQLVELP